MRMIILQKISLRNNFKKVKTGKVKGNKGDVVTEADFAAEKIVIDGLKKYFPDHDIMTEENEKAKMDGKDFLWVIDPLDGTRSFMRSIPLFATSLALTYKDKVIFGMVYLPMQDELFWAQKEEGAYLNGEKISINSEKELKYMMISLIFVDDRSDRSRSHKIYELGMINRVHTQGWKKCHSVPALKLPRPGNRTSFSKKKG